MVRKMKKKLLIFMDTLKPLVDGVSVFIDNTLPLLTKKYDITIIAPHYSDENYENVKLITFPLYKFINFDYGPVNIKRKIIKREVKKCDIILSHESASPLAASFYALKYAKRYKKPFFTYVHSIDWELFPEAIGIPNFIRKIGKTILSIFVGWYLRNDNNIVLVSFPTIEKMLRKIRVHGRFEIVPIGVTYIFKPGESKFNFNNKIVIGYVGRISREKNLNVLLNVFLKLRTKYNNLFLLIVGDGPTRGIFNKKEDVKVTGFISPKDVAEYYRAMDIFVLPSVTEANSLSTLEALKSGVCCITRNIGAIGDYLKDGYNGYFFKDDKELYDILEKLIKDEKLREKISENAGNSVLEHTWENTVNNLINVFGKYQLQNDE
jgi:1,2-diacylglycerol 3-alpha-glucosyltransferase